jgi:L-ascorbate metabolism protein UlaG (beta-lactamase superfamily)
MMRLVAAALAGTLLAGIALAGDPPGKVTIRWYGQSFFEVESSRGTRIVFDPHVIENYNPKPVAADIVLISHEHNDHNRVEIIKNAERARIFHGLRPVGKKFDWNPIDVSERDVHIRSVGVYHDAVEGMERGKNAVFVIEVGGLRIVHLGDLGHVLTPRQIKRIGPVDVLMIPVGGVYTLNGQEAKEVVQQLKPRLYVLPMHYGTNAFDDVLPADEFLEGQKHVERLRGNKLVVDANQHPAQPTIVMLDWK